MRPRPMTLTQKILAHHAVGLARPWVEAGDFLRVRVDWTIASELAWNGMEQTYAALGRPPLADKDRFFLAIDHTVDRVTLAHDPRAQRLAKLSRDFARESGIRHFHDANRTILHTAFYRDLVQPGEVVLGADSHTTSHGGMGAFAIGLGGADVTVAMVLGESWLEVPEAIEVRYRGALPFGFGGKDAILLTLRELGRNTVALERSVEFTGDVGQFSTDTRFTIANMTAEFGGLNGIFAADGVVAAWLSRRSSHNDSPLYLRADEDAPYAARHVIDLTRIAPLVARPFSPDNVVPVEELLGMALDGCFIGACTTTEEELVLAGLVLEAALAQGARPAPSDKRIVVPGDLSIEKTLREAGLLEVYARAGFAVDPPGCSMCLGIASRRAGRGETWLTSQNRNYKNRMGEGSLAFLASAATVAASALSLRVADPRPLVACVDRERYARILGRTAGPLPEVRPSEPIADVRSPAEPRAGTAALARGGRIAGRVQRFGDHVDTDAIIPGQFCHLTSREELGAHAFEFVRPEFRERARAGATIVVAGEGWGSGSSREQAVWALQGAGVRAVIARSYAFIHKRNLVNEALPFFTLTDPEFHALAVEGAEVAIDLDRGWVEIAGRTFAVKGASPMLSALVREGGLVPAVRRYGKGVFAALAGG